MLVTDSLVHGAVGVSFGEGGVLYSKSSLVNSSEERERESKVMKYWTYSLQRVLGRPKVDGGMLNGIKDDRRRGVALDDGEKGGCRTDLVEAQGGGSREMRKR